MQVFEVGAPPGMCLIKLHMVGVSTDDLAHVASHPDMVETFCEHCKKYFPITIQQPLSSMIGNKITVNDDDSTTITSKKATEIFIEDCYPNGNIPVITTPLPQRINLAWLNNAPRCNQTRFLRRIGKLIQLVPNRHDLATTCSIIASRSAVATENDMLLLQAVGAFVHFSKEVGITFKRTSVSAVPTVRLVHMTDIATNMLGRMQMGRASSLNLDGGCYAAKSKPYMKLAPTSTCEGEAAGGVEVTKDAIMDRQMLAEMGLCSRTVKEGDMILTDNASLITVTSNFSKVSHALRHALQNFRFLMDAVRENVVKFFHIIGKKNGSDLLTCPSGPTDHWNKTQTLQGSSAAVTRCQQLAANTKSDPRFGKGGPKDETDSEEIANQAVEIDSTQIAQYFVGLSMVGEQDAEWDAEANHQSSVSTKMVHFNIVVATQIVTGVFPALYQYGMENLNDDIHHVQSVKQRHSIPNSHIKDICRHCNHENGYPCHDNSNTRIIHRRLTEQEQLQWIVQVQANGNLQWIRTSKVCGGRGSVEV